MRTRFDLVRRWRSVVSVLALLLAGCAGTPSPSAAGGEPEWVKRGGASSAYPTERFVTGFGMAEGKDEESLQQAKSMAASDLARRISVRIESELSDISQERNGRYDYEVAAVTRSTSDVQLTGLDYEVHRKRKRTYALAIVERASAANQRRAERDRAMQEVSACVEKGEAHRSAGRPARALEVFEDCRQPLAEALQHDSVAGALLPGRGSDAKSFQSLVSASRKIDEQIDAVLGGGASSLSEGAERLALQLKRQGVDKRSRLSIGHFSYGTTDLSSSFGRQAGMELERAMASGRLSEQGSVVLASSRGLESAMPAHLAIRGVYIEEGEQRVRLSATAVDVGGGRLVASAQTSLPRSALAPNLDLRPANFEKILQDQRALGASEAVVSGDLRLEVWTGKGRRSVLYSEGEELTLFMRVNRPAWVRLIYTLQSGAEVPIDQAYYIDESKVNKVVEYPDAFEVVAPFGAEMLHATAFTQKPSRLPTVLRRFDGVEYEIIADGLVETTQRTRGLARKKKLEIAEDRVTITTAPRP